MSYTLSDHLNEILKEEFEKIKQEFKGVKNIEIYENRYDAEWVVEFYNCGKAYLEMDFNINNFAEMLIEKIKRNYTLKFLLTLRKEITNDWKDTLIEYLKTEEGNLTDFEDDNMYISELIALIEDENLRNALVDKEVR